MGRIVKKPEMRRREIIAVSRELFLKQEYEKTTMQDVMNALKIAKGTAYHYFSSKEELLEAVIEDMADEYIAVVDKALSTCNGDALEKLRLLVNVGKVASQKETIDNLHQPGNMLMHNRLLGLTITKLAPFYEQVIRQGCKEGIFQTKHPLESAEFLLAGIQFLTDLGCYPWTEQTIARRVMSLPSLCENQLGASAGTLSFIFDQGGSHER